MSHQGYKNYETFSVAAKIDNDQGMYYRRNEIMDDVLAQHDGDTANAASDAVDALKSYVEDELLNVDEMGNSLAVDLIRGALSEVDWYELAADWLGEAKERYASTDE
jgi:hypothetical protein